MFTVEQAEAGLTPELSRTQLLAREIHERIDSRERACALRFVEAMREPAHSARMCREMRQPDDDREALHDSRMDLLERTVRS